MKYLVLAVTTAALILSAAVAWLASQRVREAASAEGFTHRGTPATLEPLWPAPEFSFKDQSGAPVSRAQLLGTPWVANFVFTTCKTVCPMLTAKMVRLQRALDELPVRFVSFSVDPKNDTVEALAAYAQRWNAEEKRWHLLATTEAALPSLAKAFHITAERTDAGVDPILHSTLFALVDPKGQVVGVFDLEDAEDFHGLVAAVKGLAQPSSPSRASPAAAERTGQALYAELSCAQCHDDPLLAPPLGGLLGKRRRLDTSLEVSADEAYLRESILAPAAKRVRGYPLMMPAYAGHLTPGELDALVAFVTSLPAPGAAQPALEAGVAVDPICQMEVRVGPGALHVGDTYFCSKTCLDRFVASGGR